MRVIIRDLETGVEIVNEDIKRIGIAYQRDSFDTVPVFRISKWDEATGNWEPTPHWRTATKYEFLIENDLPQAEPATEPKAEPTAESMTGTL